MVNNKIIKIITIPNIISILRLLTAPLLLIIFDMNNLSSRISIPVFLLVLLISDFVDGYIARNFDQESDLGKILDAFADKIFTIVITLSLYIYHGLSIWFLYIVLVRDIFIVVGNVFSILKFRKVVLHNIFEKLSTISLIILSILCIYDYIWYSFLSSIVFMILSLALIILSFLYFLIKYTRKLLFKSFPILKNIITIVIIFTFIIGSFLIIWNKYIIYEKSNDFYNSAGTNTDNLVYGSVKEADDSWQTEEVDNDFLVLGPVIGRMSEDSAVIWVMTDGEKELELKLYSDANRFYEIGESISILEDDTSDEYIITTKEKDGYTGYIEVNGLEADTVYYYDIIYEWESVIDDKLLPYCKFTTFPEQGSNTEDLRFMVTSGHKPLDLTQEDYYRSDVSAKQFRMWESFLRHSQKEHFDFMLLIGDQVYNDAPYYDTKPTPEEFENMREDHLLRTQKEKEVREAYRKNYIKFWSHLSLRKVMASVPSFMIWDDHEFINGWGSTDQKGNPIYDFMEEQAVKVYNEFQNVFNPIQLDNDNRHYQFRYADTAFIIPDLRYHKDVSKDVADKPMLGIEQYSDIEKQIASLKESEVSTLFLGMSLPFIDQPHWLVDRVSSSNTGLSVEMKDRWYYKKNRSEMIDILDMLFDLKQNTETEVYTLGGDIHVSLLSRISKNGEHIYEFTSSGISNEDTTTQNLYQWTTTIKGKDYLGDDYSGRILKIVNKINYGVVEVSDIGSGVETRFYIAMDNPYTPNSVDYRLMYKSNLKTLFPKDDVKVLKFND